MKETLSDLPKVNPQVLAIAKQTRAGRILKDLRKKSKKKDGMK